MNVARLASAVKARRHRASHATHALPHFCSTRKCHARSKQQMLQETGLSCRDVGSTRRPPWPRSTQFHIPQPPKHLGESIQILEQNFQALQYRPRLKEVDLQDKVALKASALSRHAPEGQRIKLPDRNNTSDSVPTFACDGNMIAWGSKDGLFVLDPVTGQVMYQAKQLCLGDPSAVHFNPQKRLLAAHSSEKKQLHTLYQRRFRGMWYAIPLDPLPASKENDELKMLNWSPDGNALACVFDGSLHICARWKASVTHQHWTPFRSGDFIAWVKHKNQLTLLSIFANGAVEVYGPDPKFPKPEGDDGVQRIRQLKTQYLEFESDFKVTCAASAPFSQFNRRKNTFCAVACDEAPLSKVYLLKGNGELHKAASALTFLAFSPETVAVLKFSPDGSMIAAGGTGGGVQFWQVFQDTLTRGPEGFIDERCESITSLAWSPDSSMLATGSADGAVAVWCVVLLDVLYEWKPDADNTGAVSSLEFFGRDLFISRDGESICVHRVPHSQPYDELTSTWSGRHHLNES